MQKQKSSAVVAAPTEPKTYTAIYPFPFGGETHNIQYMFSNQKDSNGYYEQLQMRSISGSGQPALMQFAGSVLNRPVTREAFELWLTEQIALQEKNKNN